MVLTAWLRCRVYAYDSSFFGFKVWEFPKIGVPYFGYLIIRLLLFRHYLRVPYVRKLHLLYLRVKV